jgi:energy-coupling factor transporter ATP-binding protein EcfA2
MTGVAEGGDVPAILVVLGASGAGKTTLVRRLAALELPGIGCYSFDDIGISSQGDSRFTTGEAFQNWALDEWITRLARNDDRVRVAVLDASVRPSAVRDTLARHGVQRADVVLVDCEYAERNARLRGLRGQPELANAQMDCWAAYLRGQADALGIAVLDTTGAPPDDGVGFLRERIATLSNAALPARDTSMR